MQQMNDTRKNGSLKILPLASNVAFCKLATRIQDALATTPLLKFEDLTHLDAELLRWRNELPSMLRPPLAQKESITASRRYSGTRQRAVQESSPVFTEDDRSLSIDEYQSTNGTMPTDNACPAILKTPRAIMHWRYQNLRLLLHRPYLLATALRGTPYTSLSVEEKVAVARCRTIAAQTISDISKTCEEELIAGWNAVWLLYQAVMVPLVSLFSALSTSGPRTQSGNAVKVRANSQTTQAVDSRASDQLEEDMRNWRQQIEMALSFFDHFTCWSVAAKRSKDVVTRLYEASKQIDELNALHKLPVQVTQQQQESQISSTGLLSPMTNMQGSGELDFTDNPQNFLINANMGLVGQSTWGLSPNGDAAMTNFWFDDMMWDFPTAEFEMPENSRTGLGGCEPDWFSTLDSQEGEFRPSWGTNGFEQGSGQGH